MKKHLIIAIALFVLITGLSLASNFIHWDETPLEQSMLVWPLLLGLILEMPFLGVMGLFVTGDTTDYTINYELIWTVIPFITGFFYAGLYYLLVFGAKRIFKKKLKIARA